MKKYVVVTGAYGGIGQAVVKELLTEGFGVWAVGTNEEKLKMAFQENKDVKTKTCDLSNLDSIAPMMKEMVAETGPVAGLVHCAGFDKLSPLYLNRQNDIAALFNIHVFAAMELCKHMAKKGNAADNAGIVLISSLSAHEGAKGHTAYAAAKGALEGFLAPAAAELADRKIRINEVVLGVVQTAMSQGFIGKMDAEQKTRLEEGYPLGIGKPDDVAGMIAFLISEKAKWITGQKIFLDGGHLIRG